MILVSRSGITRIPVVRDSSQKSKRTSRIRMEPNVFYVALWRLSFSDGDVEQWLKGWHTDGEVKRRMLPTYLKGRA